MTMWFNGALPIVTISRVNSCVTRSTSSRFTTKRAILPSYEFTPRGPQLGGPFVLPDARPSSKQKVPRGKETRHSKFVLRKQQNEVLPAVKPLCSPASGALEPLAYDRFQCRFGISD